jgi:hypothetical protein
LLQLPQWLRLQRWLALFHWLLSQLRWRHLPPLSLQSLWWSLPLLQPELRLALSPLLSVVPVLLACSMQLLLLPIRFELHSLKPLRWSPLQRLLLPMLPVRLLCRLL